MGIVSTRGYDTAAIAGQLGDTCEMLCVEDVFLILSGSHEHPWMCLAGELESEQ